MTARTRCLSSGDSTDSAEAFQFVVVAERFEQIGLQSATARQGSSMSSSPWWSHRVAGQQRLQGVVQRLQRPRVEVAERLLRVARSKIGGERSPAGCRSRYRQGPLRIRRTARRRSRRRCRTSRRHSALWTPVSKPLKRGAELVAELRRQSGDRRRQLVARQCAASVCRAARLSSAVGEDRRPVKLRRPPASTATADVRTQPAARWSSGFTR